MPQRDVTTLVEKLKTQKGIVIEQKMVPGANHFFDGKVEPLMQSISAYLDKRLKGGRATARRDATATLASRPSADGLHSSEFVFNRRLATGDRRVDPHVHCPAQSGAASSRLASPY